MIVRLALVSIAVVVTGCTTLKPEAVVSPSEVTVEEALKSVATGLASMKKELDKYEFKTGLLVDEVNLTLNLTSKATDSKTLAVDVSNILVPSTAGITGKMGLQSTEYAEGARGSTLTIKLKNNKDNERTPLASTTRRPGN